MRTKTILFALACAGLLARNAAAITPFTGPTSPYYLNAYDNGHQTIYVVQGTSVINSFHWAYNTAPYGEATLAVSSTVNTRANPVLASTAGAGGQYTLSGTTTGVAEPYQKPTGVGSEGVFDGTSDGTHNYYVQYEGFDTGGSKIENVYQTDLNWQNPTFLFSVQSAPGKDHEYEGIAYDPVNNSLWIGGEINEAISDYSLAGNLLFSFNPNHGYNDALGYDPKDNTLWISKGQTNTLEQWSTTGILLQSGTPTGLPSTGFYASGDFSITPTPPPSESFQVQYVNQASSNVKVINDGAAGGVDGGGNICVNMYVFSASQVMQSCCSCLVSPNGLASLSIGGSASPPLGIELLSTYPNNATGPTTGPYTCNATVIADTGAIHQTRAPGLAAWTDYTPLSSATHFQIRFLQSNLSTGEAATLASQCTALGRSTCGGCPGT